VKRVEVEVEADSCEFPAAESALGERRHLAFHPEGFTWDGVTPAVYKSNGDLPAGMGWRDVIRQTLIGGAEGAQFQLRYFEIAPGGFSSLEKHAHVHAIIVLRGAGDVIVGTEVFRVQPFDVVYVPPSTPHQFVNAGGDAFGFLCPVDADRDRPQALTPEELAALLEIPTVRQAVRGVLDS
jgi:quercetin dioxygenase-like cupin family protein